MKAEASYPGFPVKQTLTLLAALLISGNASAAANPLCDKQVRNRDVLDEAALLIENVDHVPPVGDRMTEEAVDLADPEVSAPSPLLSFSPRVESMLEKVFESPEVATDPVDTSNSPVADNDHDAAAAGMPSGLRETSLEMSPDISRIHRQMFRNDI